VSLALLVLMGGLALFGVVLVGRYVDGLAWRASLTAFTVRLPSGLTVEDVARWLSGVAATTHAPRLSLLPFPPIALEVVATKDGIEHVLLVPETMQGAILGGLRAALPGVRATETPQYLTRQLRLTTAAEVVLTSHRRVMAVDRAEGTATGVLAALQPLYGQEIVVVQWILTGAGTPAPIPSAVAQHRAAVPWWLPNEDLSDGEAIRAARLKQTDVLLHGSVRVGVSAGDQARAYSLFGRVFGTLRGLNAPGVLVVRRWWVWPRWAAHRLRDRVLPIMGWPLLLGSKEAAGLLPLPVGEGALPGLSLGVARQLPPSPGMPTHGVQFGVSNYPGMSHPLRLTAADRLHHLHLIGPTGVGKSTLLANLIVQDVAAGYGVVVIDPKGDLCADVLARIPAQRTDAVIVLDPAATERPVGFNILQAAHDEQSRELVVDHVIHIWHELYRDFWGPRSEDVLRGALLTLINTKAMDGSAFTLIEVPELLTNAGFRRFVISQPGVPAGLDSFWNWYQGIKATDRLKVIGPILNKLRATTLRSPIRLMLGQTAGLDLSRVLAQQRVLLVPLSKGTLGAETASLLGTLQLAALWQAILGRIRLPTEQRRPVFVYIDEAQDVLRLPVDMADMLAQARGLGASFTVAHQHLGQIDNKQVKSALLGTVRSQVVFQCQRDDATVLGHAFTPWLGVDDLMGLDAFEVAVRPSVGGRTIAPVTGTTLPLPALSRDGLALAAASRARYGTPRSAVEAALTARRQTPGTPDRRPGRSSRTTGDASFGRRHKADGGSEGSP